MTSTLRIRPRVYLAGPSVFRKEARDFGDHLKRLCEEAGLEGSYPLDNEIVRNDPLDLAQAIYEANVTLIEQASAIVAEITPFRGPNMDPGTAWELGYGIAKGLPIFLWTADTRTILERTTVSKEVDGFYLDDHEMKIEDFGLSENLMIAAFAGVVHPTVEDAIAACSKYLAQT